ncbi:hypothetical protein GPECTOR_6g640 [Gonium pectorale]|uniref:Rhodanese domain-containing protein n=1 Tax=Gonium pectorale TaxID=33097 RepID=A0A150GVD8_GONPE|nr:hypothetical protein GPECTOR_6g640 [Gonium pectorale]|eukprot:KXZ53723.1 hypothetical protein GPECTOR_6g640 [Gonium pectorale]
MAEELVAPEIPRLTAEEVVKVVNSPGVVVVDVRDPKEVEEGRIVGSINVPASVFKSEDKSTLDEVIKSKLNGASEVVVHCHFSKVRGPTCAKALNDRLKALGLDQVPEVKVLAGGVAGFMDKYKEESALVELPPGGWNPAQTH